LVLDFWFLVVGFWLLERSRPRLRMECNGMGRLVIKFTTYQIPSTNYQKRVFLLA